MENKKRKKPKEKRPRKLRLRNFLWQRTSRSKSEKCNRLRIEYTERLRLEFTKFLIICMFMNLFFSLAQYTSPANCQNCKCPVNKL